MLRFFVRDKVLSVRGYLYISKYRIGDGCHVNRRYRNFPLHDPSRGASRIKEEIFVSVDVKSCFAQHIVY